RRRSEVTGDGADGGGRGRRGRAALGLEVLAYGRPRDADGVGQLLDVHGLALAVVPVHEVGQAHAEEVVHARLPAVGAGDKDVLRVYGPLAALRGGLFGLLWFCL